MFHNTWSMEVKGWCRQINPSIQPSIPSSNKHLLSIHCTSYAGVCMYVCVCVCVCVCMPSHVWLFVTLWTVAWQASLTTEFCRQEYWSGLSFPSPRIFLTQASNPSLLRFLHWQANSLPLHHLGSPDGKPRCWYNRGQIGTRVPREAFLLVGDRDF